MYCVYMKIMLNNYHKTIDITNNIYYNSYKNITKLLLNGGLKWQTYFQSHRLSFLVKRHCR